MAAIATIEGSVELIALSSIDEHEAGKVVPEMRPDEWTAFLTDVSRRGIQEPVVVCKWKRRNVLLDGRHRVRAARIADHETIPARVIQVDEKEQLDWIVKAALHRRHLNESQRGMLGARTKEAYAEAAKEREHARKTGTMENLPQSKGAARDQAAAAVGVSGKTVDAASKVIASGTPELVAAVDDGKVSVSKAAELADLPKPDQREAVKAALNGMPTPVDLARDEPGRRLVYALRKLDVFVAGSEKLGGVKKLRRTLSAEDRKGYAERLRRLSKVFVEWAKVLEG